MVARNNHFDALTDILQREKFLFSSDWTACHSSTVKGEHASLKSVTKISASENFEMKKKKIN